MDMKMMLMKSLGVVTLLNVGAGVWAMDVAKEVDAAAGGTPTAAQEVRPLLVGASVPDVTLQSPEGASVSLLELVKQQRSVIIFYRGGWCPYCNVHLGQLQSAEGRLKELGYQILALSADRPEKLNATTEKHHLGYRLLSDASMTAAREFGIAFKVDDATLEVYQGYGIDLEEASGQTHHRLPVPSVFLADTSGKIVFAHVDPDYKTRLASDVLLTAAEAAIK